MILALGYRPGSSHLLALTPAPTQLGATTIQLTCRDASSTTTQQQPQNNNVIRTFPLLTVSPSSSSACYSIRFNATGTHALIIVAGLPFVIRVPRGIDLNKAGDGLEDDQDPTSEQLVGKLHGGGRRLRLVWTGPWNTLPEFYANTFQQDDADWGFDGEFDSPANPTEYAGHLIHNSRRKFTLRRVASSTTTTTSEWIGHVTTGSDPSSSSTEMKTHIRLVLRNFLSPSSMQNNQLPIIGSVGRVPCRAVDPDTFYAGGGTAAGGGGLLCLPHFQWIGKNEFCLLGSDCVLRAYRLNDDELSCPSWKLDANPHWITAMTCLDVITTASSSLSSSTAATTTTTIPSSDSPRDTLRCLVLLTRTGSLLYCVLPFSSDAFAPPSSALMLSVLAHHDPLHLSTSNSTPAPTTQARASTTGLWFAPIHHTPNTFVVHRAWSTGVIDVALVTIPVFATPQSLSLAHGGRGTTTTTTTFSPSTLLLANKPPQTPAPEHLGGGSSGATPKTPSTQQQQPTSASRLFSNPPSSANGASSSSNSTSANKTPTSGSNLKKKAFSPLSDLGTRIRHAIALDSSLSMNFGEYNHSPSSGGGHSSALAAPVVQQTPMRSIMRSPRQHHTLAAAPWSSLVPINSFRVWDSVGGPEGRLISLLPCPVYRQDSCICVDLRSGESVLLAIPWTSQVATMVQAGQRVTQFPVESRVLNTSGKIVVGGGMISAMDVCADPCIGVMWFAPGGGAGGGVVAVDLVTARGTIKGGVVAPNQGTKMLLEGGGDSTATLGGEPASQTLLSTRIKELRAQLDVLCRVPRPLSRLDVTSTATKDQALVLAAGDWLLGTYQAIAGGGGGSSGNGGGTSFVQGLANSWTELHNLEHAQSTRLAEQNKDIHAIKEQLSEQDKERTVMTEQVLRLLELKRLTEQSSKDVLQRVKSCSVASRGRLSSSSSRHAVGGGSNAPMMSKSELYRLERMSTVDELVQDFKRRTDAALGDLGKDVVPSLLLSDTTTSTSTSSSAVTTTRRPGATTAIEDLQSETQQILDRITDANSGVLKQLWDGVDDLGIRLGLVELRGGEAKNCVLFVQRRGGAAAADVPPPPALLSPGLTPEIWRDLLSRKRGTVPIPKSVMEISWQMRARRNFPRVVVPLTILDYVVVVVDADFAADMTATRLSNGGGVGGEQVTEDVVFVHVVEFDTELDLQRIVQDWTGELTGVLV